MNIGYVLGSFPRLSETFILREMTALKARGVHVLPFVLRRGRDRIIHDDAAPFLDTMVLRPRLRDRRLVACQRSAWREQPRRYLHLLGAVLSLVPRHPAYGLKVLRNVPAAVYFACAARQANITHLHAHFAFVPTDVAMLMSRWLDVGFSFSAHAWDIYSRHQPSPVIKVSRARFVTACTEHGRQRLLELCPGVPEDKVVLLRHGIFPDRYLPEANREPIILAVGRLEAKKGFSYLVEACRLLAGRSVRFQCIVVGDGSLHRRLERQIRRSGLQDRFVLKGACSQPEILRLYARSTVLAVPSVVARQGDRDGLPNVIIEAMAMELPVVGTSVSAIPELVCDGRNGYLVPPRHAALLADRLAAVLQDPDRRCAMGKAGRREVLEAFDISRNIDKLIALFESHSRRPACPPP